MALTLLADGRLIAAEPGQNLLAAGLQAGLEIPYFCWHPALGAVGACRQCAIKIFDGPADTKGRIVMACMTQPSPGLRLSVEDPEAAAFREAVIEMVLTNHPHDCPVCEVGGECHLQDMTVLTGHHARRHHFPKRTHLNQNLGPFIRHEMNRCIGCYRCVRFYQDFAGGTDFGVFGAARNIYFGRAQDGALQSPFAGNLVEVCPTGVFVDKPFSANFRRKWDLRSTPSICPHCAVGCNITVQERAGTLRRVVNRFNATLNGDFLCDRGRFGTGFVNSPARLKISRDKAGNALSPRAAQEKLAEILRADNLIAIGSPRASVESNFALRELAGAENFFAGFSAFDSAALQITLNIFRHIRPATLQQASQADAFLALGDDPALVAPILALTLRQAARHCGPASCFTATTAPCWLNAATTRTGAESPLAFATALLNEVSGATPASPVAAALLSARQPVIVAGGDAALFATAANLVLALRRAGTAAQLSLLVPEANSLGLGLLDTRPLHAAAAAAAGRDVLVLERDLLCDPAAAHLLAAANSITVLDSITTPTTAHAHLAIAAATFAESDGIFINLEGRAQPFFKAIFGPQDPPPAWHLLRDAGIAAGRRNAAEWQNHAALLANLAAAHPALAPCARAWPATPDARPPTLPHRHSGRTAADANINVREPAPPRHHDSPFGTTMETALLHAPAAAALAPWLPGWNSLQAGHRTENRAAGHDAIFLFQDSPCEAFAMPTRTEPADRPLGREALSSLAPAIIARSQAGS
jgi:NADH-quinone oxidoreductase subunit G